MKNIRINILKINCVQYSLNVNKRVFSHTASKNTKSEMMSKIEKLIEKNKAFDKSTKDYANMLERTKNLEKSRDSE
jgi:hypothetical protein